MDQIFKEKIVLNSEVYVDDILVKSKKTKDHWADLQETFKNHKKYGLRLKVGKCTFGVFEGKFFSYIIVQEEIN